VLENHDFAVWRRTVTGVEDWALDTADPIGVVTGRLGSLQLYELRDPVAVVIVARGAISLRMIRREIEFVTTFAAEHPQGWCYLGDVRRVRLLNPLNLVALQRIGRLPGVRSRVIVAPRLARWLEPIAIGELTTSTADALARC
jgi:hypothetical protein